MARYGTTGRIAIYFAPTIASMAAPKVSEISAGVNLSDYVTRDGLKTPSSGNTIDAADIGSRFNKTAPGTYGGDAAEITAHRDSKSTTDLAWSTLPQDAIGFLIVARQGFAQSVTTGLGTKAGTPTVADRCEVYPVTVISRAANDTGDNETSKFTASLAITGEPAQDAVVAT
ncbi:hypothetical protein RM863_35295 [Streptomyces sp. DSM 41014]|uniref:Major tail protein n=1 Tax=Streptomyces hintoniae TaxID=3075521 RepID=A0ABU2UVU1_9ACTN|nr:hypothetical protein [Streptomyces sp. DSM 41014]MDT0477401.1 hypothetical protein [Streptomyces sp. DSM 41014]